MTTVTVPSTEEFEVLPAGTYTARLMDFKEVDKKPEWISPENPDPKQWEWWFEMAPTGAEEGGTIRRWTSRKMGRGSKARETIEALLGRELVTGEEVDIEDLIDKRCRLVLSETKKDGTPGNIVLQALAVKAPKVKAGAGASSPAVPRVQLDGFPEDLEEDIPFN